MHGRHEIGEQRVNFVNDKHGDGDLKEAGHVQFHSLFSMFTISHGNVEIS